MGSTDGVAGFGTIVPSHAQKRGHSEFLLVAAQFTRQENQNFCFIPSQRRVSGVGGALWLALSPVHKASAADTTKSVAFSML